MTSAGNELFEAFLRFAHDSYPSHTEDLNEYGMLPRWVNEKPEAEIALDEIKPQILVVINHMLGLMRNGSGKVRFHRAAATIPEVTDQGSASHAYWVMEKAALDAKKKSFSMPVYRLHSAATVCSYGVAMTSSPARKVKPINLPGAYFAAVSGADFREVCILLDKLKELR